MSDGSDGHVWDSMKTRTILIESLCICMVFDFETIEMQSKTETRLFLIEEYLSTTSTACSE